MDYFGINSANDLPKIKEILNQEIIEATKIERDEKTGEEIAAEKSINAEEGKEFIFMAEENKDKSTFDVSETEDVPEQEIENDNDLV